MSPRPLIGVSTSEVRVAAKTHPLAESDPQRRELALGLAYLESIERAGGVPMIMAPMPPEATDALLERLDGICLSGGPDLHPSSYGEEPHEHLGPTEPALDAFELGLVRRAEDRGLPVLAICRGAQLLNVARGGTLVQHLPDVGDDEIEHRQLNRAERVTHRVRVRGSSRLGRVTGRSEIDVNSFHHQAVDRLGEGLRVVAWSPDGVVEAIEDPGPAWIVGVQWHAECLAGREEQDALFSAFVAAAARYRGAAEPLLQAA